MLLRCLIVAVLALSSAIPRAQPPAAVEIPFDWRDGLLWVKVAVPQSTNLLNFLVDSGANVSVVDLSLARRLGLKLGRRVEVRGVNARAEGYWPVALSAAAAGAALPDNFLAVDLSRLSQSCVCSVDGLLGADFFLERVVQIDFDKKTIRLFERAVASTNGEILPLEIRRGVLQLQVEVNNAAPGWVRLDTGCASSLEWVVSHHPPRAESFKMSIGLAEIRIPESLLNVRLGSRKHSVLAGLHERELFPSERGLLGTGFLSRFARVTVDAKGGRLILERRPLDEEQ